MRTFGLSLLLFVSACSSGVEDIYSVPPDPTYDKDVRFYLADHCVLCHGSPPNRGAPSSFRLDVYQDPAKPAAFDMASSILSTVDSGHMPPGGGLGPKGKEMLRLWVEHGAP